MFGNSSKSVLTIVVRCTIVRRNQNILPTFNQSRSIYHIPHTCAYHVHRHVNKLRNSSSAADDRRKQSGLFDFLSWIIILSGLLCRSIESHRYGRRSSHSVINRLQCGVFFFLTRQNKFLQSVGIIPTSSPMKISFP
jgi:hypothetical protein